jgi:isopenicillin-N N-acyltransferase-like protein
MADRQITAPRTFPFYRVTGTHRQIGRQIGEACADLIRLHREHAEARLSSQQRISQSQALAAAARFRPYVLEHAPFLDEEVQGVAEGAGLTLAEAYLLQLRAELSAPSVINSITGAPAEVGDECTTFAVLGEATSNGKPLVAQNADLAAFYGDVTVVLEIVPDDQPAVITVTPAGQVSYMGMNDQGLGVFANFITCDGWRVGFPRYFYSRLALAHETVDDAINAIRSVPRASSRNMIMADSHGSAADLETTPTRDARLDPVDGLLAHTNHYVAESLLAEERSTGAGLANSKARLVRINELLVERRGQLNPEVAQELMRDRVCHPDTICRAVGDAEHSDVITFASAIASPGTGEMWVAVGPPHLNPYERYTFGA